jgi:methylenetetrahydrofolate--tRNA-(uracil-5-)-methyltransferase
MDNDTTSPTSSAPPRVTVIGGGLAGSECAFQLAERGIHVDLFEMKPTKRSPAHKGDGLAELVCSNSLRSDNVENAVGLLHAELRSAGSVILRSADETRVPAGDALAVDRDRFSGKVTELVKKHPRITLHNEEMTKLPSAERGITIVATGPLTSDALALAISEAAGERLYFYDAIAPIVQADTIDMEIAFRGSRYGKGNGDDYLNLPMSEGEYHAFVKAVCEGQKVVPHEFEEPRYFEGCLPIEVMAERGPETLAFGPMKPVGLSDPRHPERPRPYAVVQLRREDQAGTSYNLVGFQTRLTWPEQKRIFRAFVPGLANVEFVRLGQVHRNTFIDSPRLLAPDLSLAARPHLFFAGQITGVEGYVESCACGLLVALSVHARLSGNRFAPPPATTALGALYRHVTGEAHPPGYDYQPTNVIFGLFPPLEGRVKKHERKAKMVERAQRDLSPWLAATVRGVAEARAR